MRSAKESLGKPFVNPEYTVLFILFTLGTAGALASMCTIEAPASSAVAALSIAEALMPTTATSFPFSSSKLISSELCWHCGPIDPCKGLGTLGSAIPSRPVASIIFLTGISSSIVPNLIRILKP